MEGPWERYGDQGSDQGPWTRFQDKPEVPDAFIDRVEQGSAISRILSKTASKAREGFGGSTPTGLSDETLDQLINLGIFHDPTKGNPGPIQFANETLMLPTAKAVDTLLRGVNAGIYGAAGAFGEIVDALGGQGKQAEREAINFANFAMIEGGMGRFSRPKMSPAGPHDQVIGGLPTEGDFKAAAAIVSGGKDTEAVEKNIRDLWQERGVHPAEAVHDAQSDAFFKHQITAYHGSAHDFDAFDISKIGTGQGSQSYGRRGLYFAENRAVAETYKFESSTPRINGQLYNPNDPLHRAVNLVDELGSREAALAQAKDFRKSDLGQYWNDVVGWLESNRPLPALEASANLYKVSINANNEHFLDWDKPLSEQSAFVRDALEKGGIAYKPEETGEDLLRDRADIHMIRSQEEVEEKLIKAGIPGIKYLDQGSREPFAEVQFARDAVSGLRQEIATGHAEGRDAEWIANKERQLTDALETVKKNKAARNITHNFVVFDHNLIEITEKNGKPISKETREDLLRPAGGELNTESGQPKVQPLSAEVTSQPPIVPLSRQPSPPAGALVTAAQKAIDEFSDIGHNIQMLTTPMARGTPEAQAPAKDFANAMRRNRWEWERQDAELVRQFTPEARERMWNAADEESVIRQELKDQPERLAAAQEHMGLSTLEPAERQAVEALQARAQVAWMHAVDMGKVQGEGLPSYTPRMIINAVRAQFGEGSTALNAIGRNLRTRTGAMKRRKYLTAEETEAAAKASLGEEAELVRDIRVLPMATAQLEDAITGQTLINNIKEAGARTGVDTVAEGFRPDKTWFTIDHPAFRKWQPKFTTEDEKTVPVKDENGDIVFQQVPIYVRGDFEGPLRSVLTTPNGKLYSAAMDIKGKTMSLIMNSPLIHNAVEWGRALPAMPGKVATFKVYFEGNRAKNNPAVMGEAIDNGLVPIGHRFFNQDISSIMEEPNLTPGRSWTAKVLGFVPGLFDEAAGKSVMSAIDKAGNFWHNTLLWDRVGDLQMGLYTNFMDDLMAKGVDRQTASRAAAHWANRYAGALPIEAMSDNARKIANMLLFSRSFTLGNIGAMKDMLTGLPRDVMAQISRDVGSLDPNAAGYIKKLAVRKAIAIVMMDMGLMYVGNSILQSTMNVLKGDNTLDGEMHGYASRLSDALQNVKEHPLSLLQPFNFLQSVSSTSENEPGKQDRLRIGYAKDGTAIYARNPAGKIGEEFTGWLTGPLDMIRRKLGTIARPVWQILANDKGFGRKVYDPNADTPAKYLKNMSLIATHLATSQIPEGQISAFADLVKGEGDSKVAALQALGPIVGITFSRGAPGGPAVGELYHDRQEHQYQVDAAIGDIRKQIQRGDIVGARQQMNSLGIPKGLQEFYIRTAINPATRLGGHTLRDFYLYATPEQRQRLENARTISQQQYWNENRTDQIVPPNQIKPGPWNKW